MMINENLYTTTHLYAKEFIAKFIAQSYCQKPCFAQLEQTIYHNLLTLLFRNILYPFSRFCKPYHSLFILIFNTKIDYSSIQRFEKEIFSLKYYNIFVEKLFPTKRILRGFCVESLTSNKGTMPNLLFVTVTFIMS